MNRAFYKKTAYRINRRDKYIIPSHFYAFLFFQRFFNVCRKTITVNKAFHFISRLKEG